MFHKDKSIPLKNSASAFCNNLSVLKFEDKEILHYAVVHKWEINVISPATDDTVNTSTSVHNIRQVMCKEPSATQNESSVIIQAKWCQLPHRTLLVTGSQRGVQMFEWDGSVILYWYGLSTGDSGEDQHESFARGISSVGDHFICVGTHYGGVLIFNIPNKGTNIVLSEVLNGHANAIYDLRSQGNVLISSDSAGTICIWQSGSKFSQIIAIQGYGSPCCSVYLWKDLVIGGYGSGHIRLFSAATGFLHAEVCAHARWINAIDVAPLSGTVISVSEDSFLRVWQLHEGDRPEIEFRFSESITDVQLCGAMFTSPEGMSFCVSGYELNEIICFSGY